MIFILDLLLFFLPFGTQVVSTELSELCSETKISVKISWKMWGSVNILTAVFRAKSPQLRGIQTEAQIPISSTGIAALRAFKGRSRDLAVILCSSVCWGHLRDLVQSFWVYWGGYRELYVLRTPWSAKFIGVFPTCATACTWSKMWSIDWYRFDISCARSIDRSRLPPRSMVPFCYFADFVSPRLTSKDRFGSKCPVHAAQKKWTTETRGFALW